MKKRPKKTVADGSKRTLSDVLKQTFKLEAVDLAAETILCPANEHRDILATQSLHHHTKKTIDYQLAGPVRCQATSRITAPWKEGRR
jgi:hypothetical protein